MLKHSILLVTQKNHKMKHGSPSSCGPAQKVCTHPFHSVFQVDTKQKFTMVYRYCLHRLSYSGVIDPWVGGLYSVHPTTKSLVPLKGPKAGSQLALQLEREKEHRPLHTAVMPLKGSSPLLALFGNSVYTGEQAHHAHLCLLRALQMTQHNWSWSSPLLGWSPEYYVCLLLQVCLC